MLLLSITLLLLNSAYSNTFREARKQGVDNRRELKQDKRELENKIREYSRNYEINCRFDIESLANSLIEKNKDAIFEEVKQLIIRSYRYFDYMTKVPYRANDLNEYEGYKVNESGQNEITISEKTMEAFKKVYLTKLGDLLVKAQWETFDKVEKCNEYKELVAYYTEALKGFNQTVIEGGTNRPSNETLEKAQQIKTKYSNEEEEKETVWGVY